MLRHIIERLEPMRQLGSVLQDLTTRGESLRKLLAELEARSDMLTKQLSRLTGSAESFSPAASHLGFVAHVDDDAEDVPPSNPAVDAAAIVPDLITLVLNGLHEMQLLVTVHPAQHDVAVAKAARAERLDGDELPALDARPLSTLS